MIKTEDRTEQLIEVFHKNLEFNKYYSRTEIEDLMDKQMDYYYNVTALTYNRWNKGMSFICPLFEHTDRGTYRYVGSEFPYNGPLSHFPQGQYEEYIIGEWRNGKLKFSNPNIKTFKDWKESDYEGERVVSKNSKVTCLRNQEKEFKFCIVEHNDGGLTDKFGNINIDSKISQSLLGNQVGDICEVGSSEFKILKIE
jgi:hypothetical protein